MSDDKIQSINTPLAELEQENDELKSRMHKMEQKVELLSDQLGAVIQWKQEVDRSEEKLAAIRDTTIPDGCEMHSDVIVWKKGNKGTTLVRIDGERLLSAFSTSDWWRDEPKEVGYRGPLICNNRLKWSEMVPVTIIIEPLDGGKYTKYRITDLDTDESAETGYLKVLFWGNNEEPTFGEPHSLHCMAYFAKKLGH